MLRELVEKNHYFFAEEANDWQDAVRKSCLPLEADGTVECNYKEEIIKNIKKYGPYIVIAPNIAIPHAQENITGVNDTAISFMKLEKAVSFEPGNLEKNVSIFFTLASCDPDQHLNNMSRLADLLEKEEVMEALLEAKGPQDLIRIQELFLDRI